MSVWVYVVLVGPGHSVSLWLYGLPSLSGVMMQTKHLVSTEIGQTTQNIHYTSCMSVRCGAWSVTGVVLLIFVDQRWQRFEAMTRGSSGGRDRLLVGGWCLLSPFIWAAVFLIDYTPIVSFMLLSDWWFSFLELREGGWWWWWRGGNSPPHTHTTTTTPLSSLHQQTPLSPDGICCPHICIVCQSCTPTPNLLLEFAHTHKHTDMLQSPVLTLCKFWFLS